MHAGETVGGAVADVPPDAVFRGGEVGEAFADDREAGEGCNV